MEAPLRLKEAFRDETLVLMVVVAATAAANRTRGLEEVG